MLCFNCNTSCIEVFLNQAPTGHRPVCTWFLEIIFVQMSVCVCARVCVRVCVRPPANKNNSCEIKPELPVM